MDCLTRRDEVNSLFERSKRFYETAGFQAGKGFYDSALFSLEQSLQLYFKAVLLLLALDYPRIYSVRRLLELVHELTGDARVRGLLVRYSVELALLEDAYATARYVPRDFRFEEFTRVKEAVDEVFRVVGEVARRASKA